MNRSLERELDVVRQQLAESTARCAVLEQAQAAVEQLSATVQVMTHDRELSQQARAQLERHNDSLLREVAALNADRLRIEQLLEDSKLQRSLLEGTLSWRVTAPLRGVRRLVRRRRQ